MGTHNEPFVALAAGAAALARTFAAAGLQAPPADAAGTARVLAAVDAGLAAFGDVAFVTGAAGLHSACLWLGANARLLARHNRDLSRFELQRLHRWPQLVADYIEHGNRDDIVRALIDVLDAPCWPLRPSAAEFASIEANLNRWVRRTDCAPQAPAEVLEAAADATIVAGVAKVPTAPAIADTEAVDAGQAADDAKLGEEGSARTADPVVDLAPVDVMPGPAGADAVADATTLAIADDSGAPTSILIAATTEGVAALLADLGAVVARLAEPHGAERTTLFALTAQSLQHLASGAVPDASAGLCEVAQRAADNVQAWIEAGALPDAAPLFLADLAALLDAYRMAPADGAIADALLACLSDDVWPMPLSVEDAPLLRFVLVAGEDADASLASALAADAAAEDDDDAPAHAWDATLPDEGDGEAPVAGSPIDAAAVAATPVDGATIDAPPVAEVPLAEVPLAEVPLAEPPLAAPPVAAVPGAATVAATPAAPLTLTDHPAATLQRCDGEQLGILATEFGAFALSLDGELESARNDAPAATRAQAIETYAELLQRLAGVADTIGLVTLRALIDLVAARVRALRESGLDDAARIWLKTFVQHVRAYVNAPTDRSAAGAMVEILSDGSWPPALPADVAGAYEAALLAVEVFADPALRPARATRATPEEVSLAVPADINPELLDGLLAELPVQSAEFAGAIARVASGTGSLFDLESAKRAAHTLKGAANTVGVRGIASLTHHVEDVLIALTRHSALPPRALCDVLLLAADSLEAMSEALLSAAPGPADAQQVLQHVLDWANRIDDEGAAAFVADEETPAPADHQPAEAAADADAATPGDTPARAAVEQPAGAVLRVPAEIVDELLRLVGETMIANTQIKEQLRVTVDHVKSVTKQNRALLSLTGELETLVDIRGTTLPLEAKQASQDFDALEFEHYNELHTVTRRLVEAATDSKELSAASEERLSMLAELLDSQGRLHVENQNTVMKSRMVPVAGIVSRLQRSVRQTCRLLDKRVDLVVAGANTTIDGHILNDLVDPLMHLLRNAIDHGIEPAGLREARGKSTTGRIDLTFTREGTSIVVRCRDDGAGIDPTAVRRKAVSEGLITPTQLLSDDELLRLVLLPGFSTRGEATQVSGRGIGMDAVYSRVLALKGTLRLQNSFGEGLTVELRLPASLMTTHGLLARVAGQVVAIASYGVQDIRYVTADQVRQYHTGLVYQVGTQMHGLERLDELLGWPAAEEEQKRDWFPALLVQTDTGALRAVRVQEVLDSRELVVKDVGRYVAPPQGLVGVTILGDGSIAPVLDMPQLLRDPSRLLASYEAGDARGFSHIEARLSALVVDDSLSARRAAAQVMRDAGFDVRTAIDGMEAAAMLEKKVPDIILVDMEMPRMNGLEFTTHVRSREATRHVPVIMITSRSTEKHRRQAEAVGVNVYLTKPFSDDELVRHAERLMAPMAAR